MAKQPETTTPAKQPETTTPAKQPETTTPPVVAPPEPPEATAPAASADDAYNRTREKAFLSTHFMCDPGTGPLSYPAKPTKGSSMEASIIEWKKHGVIPERGPGAYRCQDPKCYVPVAPKRLPENNFEPVIVVEKDELLPGKVVRFVVCECSWDPRHCGGYQLVKLPDPKKQDAQEDAGVI